jgi:hypothetical protein
VERAGADELGYGRDRKTPSRLRGRLAVTAVVAGLSALLGWQLRGPGPRARPTTTAKPESVGTPTPSPSPTPTPTPTGFQGPVLRDGVRAEVLIGGPQTVVVALPSGRATPISGLAGLAVTQMVRVRDATVLLAGRSTGPWDHPQDMYSVADGTAVARRMPGSGQLIAAGATDRTFWVFRWSGEDADLQFTADERDLTGRLVRRVELPRNWSGIRGVVGGLLISKSIPGTAESRMAVWDPARRRTVRSLPFGQYPAAVSATRLARPDHTCGTASEGCVLHIADLRNGGDSVVALPRGYTGPLGEFTDDHSALVLTLTDGQTHGQSFLVSVETGHVMELPGSTLREPLGATLAWIPAADAAVLAALTESETTLAVWRRSGLTVELVPGRFPGGWSVAVRPTR